MRIAMTKIPAWSLASLSGVASVTMSVTAPTA
jgi:hypothetical protein